jgi:hypothetical protein
VTSKSHNIIQEHMYRCGIECNFISSDKTEYDVHLLSEEHISNIPEGKVLQKQIQK